MHIKQTPGTLWDDLRDRSMPQTHARAFCEGVQDMTVLMVATWLALQLPTGILLGRWLEPQPLLVPVRLRR